MSKHNMLAAEGVGTGGNLISNSATFTTPGATTWTCPFGVGIVSVICVGGGGAGGNGSGGGGGAVTYVDNIQVVPGTVYNINVGAGGTVSGTANGGVSWFNTSSYLYANGGSAGGGTGVVITQGQSSYISSIGLFTVPAGVYSISAVAVGGGGSGYSSNSGVCGGGGGGGLGWKNNISVTPGQQLIAVGGAAGATGSAYGTPANEASAGQDSWLGTLSVTGTGSSSTTTVTLSSGNTTGWSAYIGQTIVVISGTGRFQNRTTIYSITNSSSFVVNNTPITTLSGATFAIGTPIVAGYGGGRSNGQTLYNSTYYQYTGGSGGSYLGDGGGNGGNGGSANIRSVSTPYSGTISGNGGGGGAGGYNGAGGYGGSTNDTFSPGTPGGGSNSTGGGGGGGGGSYGEPSGSGYNAVRAGNGGGVGIYGQGANGAGGYVYGQTFGQSGTGGSGGYPTSNYFTCTTNYPGSGSNITAVVGDFSVAYNQTGFNGGWAAGSNNQGVAYATFASTTVLSLNFLYSVGYNSGNQTSYFYATGLTGVDIGAGGSGQTLTGGKGALRIIWGPGRSFPSTNTADQTTIVYNSSNVVAGGGGGAAGYSANGGVGGSASTYDSSGGAGGSGGGTATGTVSHSGGAGGNGYSVGLVSYNAGGFNGGGSAGGGAGGYPSFGGGGVGLTGSTSYDSTGQTTVGGAANSGAGSSAYNGGSLGTDGTQPAGGLYGGGGPGGYGGVGGNGGNGAVKIVWGAGTSY